MALMLRKAAEPVLQAADLDPYHADLDPNTKEFKLYTPCGKTFALVTGVRFSSLNPTKNEIVYAIELLELWLMRNKQLIDTYIDAFEKLQPLKDMPLEKDDMRVSMANHYNQTGPNTIVVNGVIINHNDLSFYLDEEGLLTDIQWINPIPHTTSFELPAAKHAAAMEFAALHTQRLNQSNKVDSILLEMNTCET